MEIPAWLAPYEPQIPLNSLVEEVNKIYHSFDAKHYDREHPEIHQQLPAIWGEMISQLPEEPRWRVLDFGCGTGFEALQVLQKLDRKIERLVVYDPSPEMLGKCKQRLHGFPIVSFQEQLEPALAQGSFDLLLTNSLLHHLPDLEQTISFLLPALDPHAYWLAGHEPSARFYHNSECVRLLENYSKYRKIAKWFKPGSYAAKIRLLSGNHKLSATAHAAFKRGLFRAVPSHTAIDMLVDFHVAHSSGEVQEGRGLDFEKLQRLFGRDWKLSWAKTYSFLGPFSEVTAPSRWVKRARMLGQRFPDDGANFCMVWNRNSISEISR